MEFMTEKQMDDQLERLKAMLNELEFEAETLLRNPLLDRPTLLINLPSEEELRIDDEGLPENLHIAVGTLTHLGDEPEDADTKYLMLIMLMQADVEGIEEIRLYQLVNEMNTIARLGNFAYGDFSNGSEALKVPFRYQLLLGTPADGFWEKKTLENSLIEMALYYDMFLEKLQELKA